MASDDIAISVRGLGKSYTISHKARRPTSLAEALMDRIRRPAGEGRKDRESFWALKDVDFEVPRGQVVGIIGRNGAGKSTLLKVLSRITAPTTGEIDIHGRVASLLEVGTGFHPELTGRENIYLNGSILGMAHQEITRQFDEIVAFAEIEKFLDTPVKRYSSGMYVRLAFAVAAHLQPEIMIVDEVLAVGDFAFQKKCLGKLHEAAVEGRTILFVSHNMPMIIQLCERALLFEKGRLAFEGPVEGVVKEYFSRGQAEQPSTILLGERKRESDVNHRARFVAMRMTTPGLVGPWSAPFGSMPAFEIEVRVEQPIPRLEFGMALCTASGLEFASPMGSDAMPAAAIEPGDYLFEIGLPNLLLTPGRYLVDLGMRSDRGMEDHVAEAIAFEIVPTEASSRVHAHLRRGAVIPDVEFVIRGANESITSPGHRMRVH